MTASTAGRGEVPMVVYETMRVKDGRVPLWRLHEKRFLANSRAVGLPPPPEIDQAVQRAIRAGLRDQQLRMTWDGRDLEIANRELPSLTPLIVKTVSIPHEGYRIKTTDRAVFDRARAEARAGGADEGLLLTDDGYVAEGTLFAIGWIDDGTLCVPSLDLGILPSVGRARVIEVASSIDLPVAEGRYRSSDLAGRAAFATTATRGVVRIARLDGAVVPTDERVERLSAGFWPSVEEEDTGRSG